MSHGYIAPEPRPPLFTVTPGQTLTAYINGTPVAAKLLSDVEAQWLVIELATAVRMTMGDKKPSATPIENLTHDAHIALRVAAGARNHAAEEDDHP